MLQVTLNMKNEDDFGNALEAKNYWHEKFDYIEDVVVNVPVVLA